MAMRTDSITTNMTYSMYVLDVENVSYDMDMMFDDYIIFK